VTLAASPCTPSVETVRQPALVQLIGLISHAPRASRSVRQPEGVQGEAANVLRLRLAEAVKKVRHDGDRSLLLTQFLTTLFTDRRAAQGGEICLGGRMGMFGGVKKVTSWTGNERSGRVTQLAGPSLKRGLCARTAASGTSRNQGPMEGNEGVQELPSLCVARAGY